MAAGSDNKGARQQETLRRDTTASHVAGSERPSRPGVELLGALLLHRHQVRLLHPELEGAGAGHVDDEYVPMTTPMMRAVAKP